MWKVKVKANFSFSKLLKKLPTIIEDSLDNLGKDSAGISKDNIDNQTTGNIGLGSPGSIYKKLSKPTKRKRRAGLYVRNEKVKKQTGTIPLKYTNALYKSIKGNKKGLYMEHYGIKHQEGENTHTTDIHGNPITIVRDVSPIRSFIGVGMSEKSEKKFYDRLRKGFKK